MSKPTMIMMSGVAGCGKSTRTKQLAREYNAIILSSDVIRKELYGDDYIYDDKDNKEVFDTLEERVLECAGKGVNVIIDSTNLIASFRAMDYMKYKELFHIVIYQIHINKEELLRRNKTRLESDRLPEEVINNMYFKLETPTLNYDCDDYIIEEISVVRS